MAVTATIRETNWFTDTWNLIYGKLEDNVVNPGNQTKFIFSGFPQKLIDKKDAYPIIVISPADVSYDPLTFNTIKRGPARITVDVYATNPNHLDSISDAIVNTFEQEEGNLQISGISVMRLAGTSYVHYDRGAPNGFRVHNKTINYTFDFGWY